jgi:hypothetical protein
MTMKKGHPKFGGRKKGQPNKVTATAKEALTLAFQGIGGVPALTEWGRDNPTEFYKLWAKLLPQEIKGEFSGGTVPFKVYIQSHEFDPDSA